MVGVTVICPNSHRCNIKVNPNTILRSVLEEACLKEGYDIDLYHLRYRDQPVDLSLFFRLTGLPNNVTLEMKKNDLSESVSEADIALQLPDGQRKCLKSSVDSNLLELLEKFSKEFNLNLLESSEEGIVPSCAYLNKVCRGKDMLKATTLKSLGICGGNRICLRFNMLKMLPEEVLMLQRQFEEESSRKRKLLVGFAARKAENERREHLLEEGEKAYERELLAKALETEEMKAPEAKIIAPTVKTKTEKSVAPAVSEPSSSSKQSSTTFDLLRSSRLARLESLRDQVDDSLNNPVQDFLADQLIAEDGRLKMESNEVRHCHSTTDSSSEFSNFKFPDVSSNSSNTMHASENPQLNSAENERCERCAILFLQSDIDSDEAHSSTKSADEDDAFYELNAADALELQRGLKEQANSVSRMVSKDYINEKNKQRKLDAFEHTVIHYVFGNGSIIQALFNSREPASHLYECLVDYLVDKSIEFVLSFGLNQKIENDPNKDLIDIQAAPSSRIYVKFIKANVDYVNLFSKQAVHVGRRKEANSLSKQWLSANKKFVPFSATVESNQTERAPTMEHAGEIVSQSRHQSSDPSSAPKWFKKL